MGLKRKKRCGFCGIYFFTKKKNQKFCNRICERKFYHKSCKRKRNCKLPMFSIRQVCAYEAAVHEKCGVWIGYTKAADALQDGVRFDAYKEDAR